mmetsp:Transcript_12324/g.27299  ORF Transcript_12324/g.27299 Transcript_12324/m.27299 type:complete len:199 (+) Transcript_12324:806-1402(+)
MVHLPLAASQWVGSLGPRLWPLLAHRFPLSPPWERRSTLLAEPLRLPLLCLSGTWHRFRDRMACSIQQFTCFRTASALELLRLALVPASTGKVEQSLCCALRSAAPPIFCKRSSSGGHTGCRRKMFQQALDACVPQPRTASIFNLQAVAAAGRTAATVAQSASSCAGPVVGSSGAQSCDCLLPDFRIFAWGHDALKVC